MKAEDQSAEREAFENEWIRYAGHLPKRAGDGYAHGPVDLTWRFWRAALSAREAPAQLPSLRFGEHEVFGDFPSLDAVRKAVAPAREGWQLVPQVASVEMCRAAAEERHVHLYSPSMTVHESAQRVWKKMLAASPQAPTTDPAPPAAKAVEMLEFDRDSDGELLIDWSPSQGRMLTLSLRDDGRLSYAVWWDGENFHGQAQMPAIDAALSKQGGNHG